LTDLVSGPVLYVRGRILLGGPADGNDEVQLTLALLHTVKNMFNIKFLKKEIELTKICPLCFLDKKRNIKGFYADFAVLYLTLLHLPPFRIHCVG
jgi:hypothetical protein